MSLGVSLDSLGYNGILIHILCLDPCRPTYQFRRVLCVTGFGQIIMIPFSYSQICGQKAYLWSCRSQKFFSFRVKVDLVFKISEFWQSLRQKYPCFYIITAPASMEVNLGQKWIHYGMVNLQRYIHQTRLTQPRKFRMLVSLKIKLDHCPKNIL